MRQRHEVSHGSGRYRGPRHEAPDECYGPIDWVASGDYRDISYETAEGIAKITICRPEVRNAFRPQTLFELADAFNRARDDITIGVIILTGAGRPRRSAPAATSASGATTATSATTTSPSTASAASTCSTSRSRSAARRSRSSPWWRAMPSAAATSCTSCATSRSPPTTPASARPARGSARFDGGYGSGLLARNIGQKKAREIWFLCAQYDAQEALDMGLVNTVVPLADLERETVAWCRRMLQLSPLALRMVKASMNAADDGLAGIQQLAGDATLLFYLSEEAQEGRDAYVEKRRPDFAKYPKRP